MTFVYITLGIVGVMAGGSFLFSITSIAMDLDAIRKKYVGDK